MFQNSPYDCDENSTFLCLENVHSNAVIITEKLDEFNGDKEITTRVLEICQKLIYQRRFITPDWSS